MCMPGSRSCILLALTTNQTEEHINFGGFKLEKWCVLQLKKHFLMFIHVHFVLEVNMKR